MSAKKHEPERSQPTPDPLTEVQREMMRIRQEVHAMQCVLDGLVAMHPRPEELLDICRQVQTMLSAPLTHEPAPPALADAEPAKPPALPGWRTVIQRYVDILEQGTRLQKAPQAL